MFLKNQAFLYVLLEDLPGDEGGHFPVSDGWAIPFDDLDDGFQ
jgi:hypothetical protein